jgi:hypothetical protein
MPCQRIAVSLDFRNGKKLLTLSQWLQTLPHSVQRTQLQSRYLEGNSVLRIESVPPCSTASSGIEDERRFLRDNVSKYLRTSHGCSDLVDVGGSRSPALHMSNRRPSVAGFEARGGRARRAAGQQGSSSSQGPFHHVKGGARSMGRLSGPAARPAIGAKAVSRRKLVSAALASGGR